MVNELKCSTLVNIMTVYAFSVTRSRADILSIGMRTLSKRVAYALVKFLSCVIHI